MLPWHLLSSMTSKWLLVVVVAPLSGCMLIVGSEHITIDERGISVRTSDEQKKAPDKQGQNGECERLD